MWEKSCNFAADLYALLPMQLLTRHGLLGLDKPVVMAILNITPDSFVPSTRLLETPSNSPSSKGENWDEERVLAQAERALAEGAAILDIGGYSTRPGAAEVSEAEEWRRVALAIGAIRRRFWESDSQRAKDSKDPFCNRSKKK